MGASRDVPTPDLQPRPSVSSNNGRLLLPVNKTSSGDHSSATWTSTSSELVSDTDELDNRRDFIDEYNRLAKKYGVRPLVPDESENSGAEGTFPRRSWWSRTFRRTSSQSTESSVKRQRSVNHVTAHMIHPKRDSLKDQDLQGLVRLCGKSLLYLPPEYAPGSLILPTCFRATAQYLVQHAPETRGVFRIPGSVRIVNELYEFYCAEQSGGDVANTVRSPNLPSHINAGVHDVASTFKKFLAGLPGGILGSLSLFDALVAINSQLYKDLEFSKTKQTKIRARLIALAVGTLRSKFRRELICAVFGLLCLLSRAAETAPREDEYGRPLPTSDLMGYNALGIVFGPLLVGDILGTHAVKLADPSAGIFLVPAAPQPKSKKEKKKTKESMEEPRPAFLDVDKIHIANDITEMLITNWRDVVRQMRSLDGTLGFANRHSRASTSKDGRSFFRPSEDISAHDEITYEKGTSEKKSCTPTASSSRAVSFKPSVDTDDPLSMKKTRPNIVRSPSSIRCISSLGVLSPPKGGSGDPDQKDSQVKPSVPLKSSLRTVSKGPYLADDENNFTPLLSSNSAHAIQLPSESNSTHALAKAARDSTPTKQGIPTPEDTPKAVKATSHGIRRSSSTESSVDSHETKNPKSISRTHGSLKRKLKSKFSRVPEHTTASADVPGATVWSGKSTMRFRPRTSRENPEIEPFKETSSGRLVGQGIEFETFHAKKPSRPKDAVAGDQVDGVVDLVVSGTSFCGSNKNLRSEFKRWGTIDSQRSSSPVQGDQDSPPTKCHDIRARPRKSLRTSLQNQPSKSNMEDCGSLKRGASKVRGLAAMFDSAAKASPIVPTPGGSVQKKRRETAKVVSPYTRNPSPHASLHSVTSVSTPASLIGHTRDSFSSSGTVEYSGRKSMIPRRQGYGITDGSGKAEGYFGPKQANPSNTRSRIPTPSRLPVRKKVSTTGSPSLTQLDTQLDGTPKTPASPFKLTAQQEIRPVGYHNSPIPPTTSIDGYTGFPPLSQHIITSGPSENLVHSRESSPPSPRPSRGRSTSSFRDQIRHLRQELSSKNEECAQLRLEYKESRKASQVNEILLREDLDRFRANCAKWKRRAERAERKVDKFERLVTRIKDARERGDGRIDQDEFSFIDGPDHIDISERSPRRPRRRQSAGAHQSFKSVPEIAYNGDTLDVVAVDAMSNCSGSTVVRNINGGSDGGNSALWTTADELVNHASPELTDNRT